MMSRLKIIIMSMMKSTMVKVESERKMIFIGKNFEVYFVCRRICKKAACLKNTCASIKMGALVGGYSVEGHTIQ